MDELLRSVGHRKQFVVLVKFFEHLGIHCFFDLVHLLAIIVTPELPFARDSSLQPGHGSLNQIFVLGLELQLNRLIQLLGILDRKQVGNLADQAERHVIVRHNAVLDSN